MNLFVPRIVVACQISALIAVSLSGVFHALSAPASIHFIHAPLVMCGFIAGLIASRKSAARNPVTRPLIVFTAAAALSAAFNRTPVAVSWLSWFLFAEPFLMLHSVCGLTLPRRWRNVFIACIAVLILAQLPACAIAVLSVGLGSADGIAGTFAGRGTGAHIAGAYAAVGVIAVAALTMGENLPRNRKIIALLLICMAALVPILADAKLIAISLAATLLFLTCRERRAAGPLLSAAAAIAVLALYSTPLRTQRAVAWSVLTDATERRIGALGASWSAEEGEGRLLRVLLGRGPGQSFSRLAMNGVRGYTKPTSTARLLSIPPSPLAERLWSDFKERGKSSSSFSSPLSSWGSILGDFGALGFLAFAHLFLSVRLLPAAPRLARLRAALLFFAAAAACFYYWLEEPSFTLLIFGLLAAVLVRAFPPPPNLSREARRCRDLAPIAPE